VTGRFGLLRRLVVLGACAGLGMVSCGGPSTKEIVEGRPWLVTVYYTAVESLHHDEAVEVTGCLGGDCENGDDPLGRYPRGFAEAVEEEGSGRITSGAHAGKYLNWSYDIGYWLDTAPRNAHGGALEPFRSAAADGVPDGTRLRLVDCGEFGSGEFDPGDDVPPAVCSALQAGQWQIQDRFTPGLGGPQHIDLYIGEESGSDFTSTGALYVSLHNVAFTLES